MDSDLETILEVLFTDDQITSEAFAAYSKAREMKYKNQEELAAQLWELTENQAYTFIYDGYAIRLRARDVTTGPLFDITPIYKND